MRHEHTFADYLQVEADGDLKHEFLDGKIYAMPGGTPSHARLSATITGLLHERLRGGECEVYSSDLRIRVAATGLAAHPDVTVVCGELEVDPESDATVTNPRVVVEVSSDSTEKFDRGVKAKHDRRIPTRGAIVLVSQSDRRIEVIAREPDGRWVTRISGPGEVVRLDAIGCTLAVDGVRR